MGRDIGVRNFYDEWLAADERIEGAFRNSPMVARDADTPWVRTRQDAKVKLMVSNRLGFPTMGGTILTGEIPACWHTGKQAHREESLHILRGCGFSVIDGQRFDWHEGSSLQTEPAELASIPSQASEYLGDGPRALIHLEDAPTDPGTNPRRMRR